MVGGVGLNEERGAEIDDMNPEGVPSSVVHPGFNYSSGTTRSV
jgi:hypothetical protein